MVTLSNSKTSPSASTMLATYASFAASVVLARSIAHELLPPPVLSYLFSAARSLLRRSTPITVVVRESSGISRNQVYEDAELYLSTKIGPSTGRIGISKTARQRKIQVAVEKDQEIVDHFCGVRVTWRLLCPASETDPCPRDKNFFELTFDSRSRQTVMESYIPFVMERAAAIRGEDKVVRLYNRDCPSDDDHDHRRWGSVILEHPSTFNTLAMDPDLKRWILDDLDRFVGRRELYKRVGKAWKRGYLLYGPPGTGKSSLVAAMANYLKFDVYDLDLSSIYSNSSLREVLLSTTNRSILVIEDIDCNKKVQDRECNYSEDGGNDPYSAKMTLSGLLNFIDGLWSSCGDERILVFTTNHKDKLDPALLRPGRMDVHINMSYCTFQSFKILASNYLGISVSDHPLCREIEAAMATTQVSPAEVAEELMKTDDTDEVLNGLVGFLKRKKAENEINGNGSESGSGSGDDERREGDDNEVPATKKKKLRSGWRGRRVSKGYSSDDDER